MRHIGLFGGTFNPVHTGHLLAAQAALEALQLDEIRFIPAAQSPLKQRPELADRHRVEMLKLALSEKAGLVLDQRELARSGPSYTIDTLHEIRRKVPDDHLYLLLGMDAWQQFDRWHDWQHIPDCCHLVVMTRPGYTTDQLPEFWHQRLETDLDNLRQAPVGKLSFIVVPQSLAASSLIREQIAAGQNPGHLLPDAVYSYIRRHELYRAGKTSGFAPGTVQ